MNHKPFLMLLLVSLLVSACGAAGNSAAPTPTLVPTVKADNSIVAEGRLEPVRYADIAFSASGVVSEVLVNEGETVTKGQPLIRLGNESDSNYAAAQLELVNAQKALNDLLNAADEDLAQAVIDLKQAKEDYKDAAQYLRYLQNSKRVPRTETFVYYINSHKGYDVRIRTKYYKKGPAPEVWIIEAQNDLGLKKAKMDEAQTRYDRMKDKGVDSEQLAVLDAQLNVAKAKLAALAVLAPFDGVVADLKAKTGGSINAGEVAVTVADFSQWLVKTTDLTEIDVVSLTEDQPVTVKLDALPDVKLNGKILSIGQTYSENQGDVVYEVVVLLSDVDPAMRWGMTASVSFTNEG